jgi:hypothetical protein
MDADGLRILAQFRAAGIPARSLFMDVPAYERWGRFGTNTDKRGNPIVAASRLEAPEQLEAHERELWAVLTNPAECGPRRIEQERIPLGDAVAAIAAVRHPADNLRGGQDPRLGYGHEFRPEPRRTPVGRMPNRNGRIGR